MFAVSLSLLPKLVHTIIYLNPKKLWENVHFTLQNPSKN